MINWDKLANHFADHDAAMERMRATMSVIHRHAFSYMEKTSEQVIRALPQLLKEHLDARRREGRAIGEWLVVWTWTNRNTGQDDKDLGVANLLEAFFDMEKIKTKHERGADDTYTGGELLVNLNDLRAHAMENMKKPRVELSGRTAKK